jgi:hypothetical protein
MRRQTDKKSKRQSRLNQSLIETGYAIPSGEARPSGYSSGYDTTATGGYQKPRRSEKYEPGPSGRKDDDGIPL